jgi:hypothetical protein
MRRIAIIAVSSASFLCASFLCAFARDHQPPQSGTILQMDSVNCGTDQKSDKSFAGEIIGTDNAHQKTHTLLCQEYLVQTDHVTYRMRPKDDKKAVLLPIGERAQFRVEKNCVKLRVEGVDDKEREYVVVSMTPRSDASHSDAQTAENRK